MEGSGQFFQLDEDDMFSSDSFLEELEQVEKVEHAVFKSKQAVSHHVPQQNSFNNTSKAAPSMPTRNATPVLPQVKTPVSGGGRKFSFKSKTSPEIPLPPDIGNQKQRESTDNIEERIGNLLPKLSVVAIEVGGH
ncbi:uncharacterized protein LOC115925822 [Strongylocentrotus purpuratus]|uniref:Uncharacterized protein n=1 Tax=Strongylocentrotus purpuratus TaxID=7668 RepID=A0A7M7P3C9_STRPU|nr:uncharacterized protein LOC115925822 [Strongylocentrotus purpuratus]